MQELYVSLLVLITPSSLGGGVGLSDNQISFSTNTVNGWQGLSGGSRAAVAANENGPLKMENSLGHPLYLHPIEQSGTYIYNAKDELVTRSGAPLPSDGNLLANAHDAKTRGSKYNDTGWSAAFGISAILTNNNTYSSYFQNQKATPSGGSWLTNNPQYWPTAGSLSFYAYAPYCDDSHSMLSENATVDVANAKTVHYVASANDVEHQPDLIIAKHESVTHGSTEAPNSVSLNFSHVLTAITFAVGSDMVPGTVKSITIKGVKNTGDYDLATNTWNTSGNPVDFTISLGNGNGTKVNGTQDVALTSGAQTLMMIPQTFDKSSNAKVEIVFNKDGKDNTLTAPLSNTQWDAGSTIIYKVSTSSLMSPLKLNTVTFPTDWSQKYTAGTLKSSYSQGDKMGLYIVDQSGLVREANVELTYNGTTWEFPQNASLRLNPGCQYFTYYPYQTSPQGGLQKGETVNVATLADANTFFKKLEDAWTPKTDQSNKDNLNASDLQVANAILSNTGSGIDLKMAHAMGLADITIGTGQVHFKLSNDASYTWDNPHLASEQFADKKPCKVADAHYVAVVKPNVSTKFNSANGVDYAWKDELSFNPAANQIVKETAIPVDKGVNSFTLELGDVYYSDGSLTHQSEDLTKDKKPIGLVGYIARGKDDYWVEKNTKRTGIGGHALVVCLGVTYGAWYAFGSLTESQQFVYEYGQNSAQIFLSHANDIHGSGYLNTQYLLSLGDGARPAAKAAYTYNDYPAPQGKSTGWFLPSVGQIYAWISTWSGMSPEKEAATNRGVTNSNGVNRSDFFDNPTFLEQTLSKYYKKVGLDFPMNVIVQRYAWTSSVSDVNNAWFLDHVFPPGVSLRHDYGIDKSYFAVMPFLAF